MIRGVSKLRSGERGRGEVSGRGVNGKRGGEREERGEWRGE